MLSVTGQCSLFLCPSEADFLLNDIEPLVLALQEIGFISQKIKTNETNNFYTGVRFLDYIAYMGCAPAIQFEASEAKRDFCHIKIHQYETAKLIINQKQSIAPLCPNCKKPISNWPNRSENKTPSQISCDGCNTTSDTEAFNWRKLAGYAQLFIEITDIFPREAIPQQILFDRLSGIYDVDWVYFYSCH